MTRLLALAFLLALAVAAPAQAWTNPLLMSLPDEESSAHAVGIDGQGNAVVVSSNANAGIFVSTRGADETTTGPVRVNTGHGTQPRIATNAAGVSALAWIATDGPDPRVHLRLRRANGSYTVDTTISPAGETASRPEVGVDNAGDAFVSWQSDSGSDTRTYLRVKSGATGTLGALRPISPATGANATPHLAVEPGGRAYMTWNANSTIMGRARSTSGALSGPTDLTGGPDAIFSQSMSLDGSGQVLIAWSSGGHDDRAVARTRSVTGHLSPITPLSTPGTDVVTDEVHAALGTSNGTGVVSWVRYPPSGGTASLQARRLTGSSWGPVVNVVSSPNITPANVAMATSATAARTTWAFSSFENGGLVLRLRARELKANDALGPLSIVSADNGMGGGPPRVAVNASGQAATSYLARLTSDGFDLVWVATNFLTP